MPFPPPRGGSVKYSNVMYTAYIAYRKHNRINSTFVCVYCNLVPTKSPLVFFIFGTAACVWWCLCCIDFGLDHQQYLSQNVPFLCDHTPVDAPHTRWYSILRLYRLASRIDGIAMHTHAHAHITQTMLSSCSIGPYVTQDNTPPWTA